MVGRGGDGGGGGHGGGSQEDGKGDGRVGRVGYGGAFIGDGGGGRC